MKLFEYYMFLHHSQTDGEQGDPADGLNTIRFYIILKRTLRHFSMYTGLNTIRFYIILKLQFPSHFFIFRLNTIRFYIILKPGL